MTRRTTCELKRMAREFLTGNYAVSMAAMLTAALLPAAVLGPFTVGITMEFNFAMATYLAAAFIVEVLGQLLVAGVIRIHLLLAKKQQLSYKDLLWPFFNHPDRFLLAALLLFGILILPAVPAGICMFYLAEKTTSGSIFIAAVFIAVVIAEVYIILTFDLIYPLYIDRPELSVMDGFRMSYTLMRGNKKRLLQLHLSFIGWQILGICSIGIGMLWIVPYIRQTNANFYLDLTEQFK